MTGTARATPRSPRDRALTALLAAGAVVALLVAAGCAVNPATGSRQINFVSESSEIRMGREADRAILAQYGAYEDTSLAAFVERVGQRLAEVSERPGLEWHFRVLDSPVVNAFALPGGYIYLTRGILAAMNSEAQLAGVIGHEIGHVTARHTAQQITQSQIASVGLVAGLIFVPGAGRYGAVLQQSLGLLFLKFGRDHENQADELGIRYMVRAGYDPRAIPATYDMLRRLSERTGGGGLPTWLSTHPDPGDRKARTSTLAHEAVLAYRDRTLAVEEESLKQRLDGLVYGEDPEEGYLVNNRFYHPGLGFQVDWPNGWGVMNTPQSVSGIAPDGGALITLTLEDSEDGPNDPAAYVAWLERRGELAHVRGQAQTIHGWDAWIGEAVMRGTGGPPPGGPGGESEPGGDERPTTDAGAPAGRGGGRGASLALIRRGEGTFYLITGLSNDPLNDGRFRNTVESFGPLRDPSRPVRMRSVVRLKRAPGDRTIHDLFWNATNDPVPADEVGWLNNFFLKDRPPEGAILKVIEKVPPAGATPAAG